MKDTEDRIVFAMYDLLKEKPYQKITVRDIIENCGINRGTFYYHYSDINDLFKQIVERLGLKLGNYASSSTSRNEAIEILEKFCIRNKTEFMNVYHSLSRKVFITSLQRFLYLYLSGASSKAFDKFSLNDEERERLIVYYRDLLTGIMIDWFSKDCSYNLVTYIINGENLVARLNASYLNQK